MIYITANPSFERDAAKARRAINSDVSGINMINYDDEKWTELDGGYSELYNPVGALLKLENGNTAKDVWEELWNELHHQGDIGMASYAAVPHLVRIHKNSQLLDWNLYALVSTIEIERHRKTNPPIPKWLESSYFEAWKSLLDLGLSDLKQTVDEKAIRSILGTIAIAKGLLKFGSLISYYDESEVSGYLEDVMAWSELYRLPQAAADDARDQRAPFCLLS
jgi:hypothetical protein